MSIKLTPREVIASTSRDLGTTDWHVVLRPGDAPSKDSLVLGGGIQPDPTNPSRREYDPFMVMTLVPLLMPKLLTISDVTENVPVGIEKVDFSSSFAPGTRVRLRAVLISGRTTAEGYLNYRVGVSVEVAGEEGYALVAEVNYLAGNPE